MKKNFYTLIFALAMICSSAFAQKNVIYITVADIAGTAPQDASEQQMVDDINNFNGGGTYSVTVMDYTNVTQENIGTLNAADVVIVARSVKSDYTWTDVAYRAVYIGITAPVIHTSPWVIRGNRFGYVTGSSEHQEGDANKVVSALIQDETNAVFNGVTITDGAMDWTVGYTSDLTAETADGAAGGTVLAKTADNRILLILHEAGVLLPATASRAEADQVTPAGPRAYMGNGQDQVPPATFWNFTDGAKTVFLNLIGYMADMKPSGLSTTKLAAKLSAFVKDGVVTVSKEGLSSVKIYSIDGKLIATPSVASNRVSVSGLKKGAYIVKADVKGSAVIGKVLVK